ncbi:MAG: hypothetical protein HFI77_06705 [Lachnospiraceae bacterium]|jgi:hypothetical protein|nr:hypothetical protein [Lachnospiraceae bacterium]
MAENPKRYSVSVSNAMKEELDVLKSSKYANVTMNRMLCDLILLGLNTTENRSRSRGSAK